jgi:hypothetical protein
LKLPEAAAVGRIEVVRWDARGQRQTAGASADARLIEQLLAHLEAHNSGYSAEWPRRSWPAQEYTISFETRESVALVVWVGRDWVGGVDEEPEPGGRRRLARRRPLGEAERERLVALLPAPAASAGATGPAANPGSAARGSRGDPGS